MDLSGEQSLSYSKYLHSQINSSALNEEQEENTEQVGQGLYGSVEKVFYQNEKIQARKIIDPQKFKYGAYFNIEQQLAQRKENQASNLAKIKGYWVQPEIFDVQTHAKVYIFMKYYDKSLTKLMSQPTSKELQPLNILVNIIDSLHFLYQTGVFSHQNLKPNNIFINKYSKCILSDFGFAQELINQLNDEKLTRTNIYYAPEIYSQDNIYYKCDVWSLGLILFEMYHKIKKPEQEDQKFFEEIYAIKEQQKCSYLQVYNIYKQFQKIKNTQNIPINVVNLIENMLQSQPKQRISFSEVLQSDVIKESFAINQQSQEKIQSLIKYFKEFEKTCNQYVNYMQSQESPNQIQNRLKKINSNPENQEEMVQGEDILLLQKVQSSSENYEKQDESGSNAISRNTEKIILMPQEKQTLSPTEKRENDQDKKNFAIEEQKQMNQQTLYKIDINSQEFDNPILKLQDPDKIVDQDNQETIRPASNFIQDLRNEVKQQEQNKETPFSEILNEFLNRFLLIEFIDKVRTEITEEQFSAQYRQLVNYFFWQVIYFFVYQIKTEKVNKDKIVREKNIPFQNCQIYQQLENKIDIELNKAKREYTSCKDDSLLQCNAIRYPDSEKVKSYIQKNQNPEQFDLLKESYRSCLQFLEGEVLQEYKDLKYNLDKKKNLSKLFFRIICCHVINQFLRPNLLQKIFGQIIKNYHNHMDELKKWIEDQKPEYIINEGKRIIHDTFKVNQQGIKK